MIIWYAYKAAAATGQSLEDIVLTKQEAVNEVLAHLGEAPVSSITGPNDELVSRVLAELNTQSRNLQLRAWAFNTDEDVTVANDAVTGEVTLPSTVARVQIHPDFQSSSSTYVVRGRRMYNRKTASYNIGGGIKFARIIHVLDWDDLPLPAQVYLTLRTARVVIPKTHGTERQELNATREELDAWAELRRDHNLMDRANILRNCELYELIGGNRYYLSHGGH